MAETKISIVIPTYNKIKRLCFLLESLCHQVCSAKFTIIIVDDGSVDGTNELIKEYQCKLPLKYLAITNSGRSAARNKGLALVNTEYVIFCDDDMILPSHYIQSHYSNNQKNPDCIIHGRIWSLPYLQFFADPQSGIVFNEAKDYMNSSSILQNYLITKDIVKNLEKIEKQKRLTGFERYLSGLDAGNQNEYLLFTGGNVSCRTEIIRHIGGFDENLDEYWGVEDLELGYRLKHLRGVNFLYCHDAYNIHISHYRKYYEDELDKALISFYKKYEDKQILKIKKILLDK